MKIPTLLFLSINSFLLCSPCFLGSHDTCVLILVMILMFADDSKLYCTIHLMAQPYKMTLIHVHIYIKWWPLSFNISKCKVLHIGSTPIYTTVQTVDLLENIRDLGAKLILNTKVSNIIFILVSTISYFHGQKTIQLSSYLIDSSLWYFMESAVDWLPHPVISGNSHSTRNCFLPLY